MENTWLWTDVSSLYTSTSTSTPAWWKLWYDVFSANEEENKYASEKAKNNVLKYFNDRSSLRRALRSWEKTTWDANNDRKTANTSVLADGIINIMINRWKDEKYMMDNYSSNEWNLKLINKVKGLEWWKYASDIDNFINWDGSNLTWTLSKIFPDTIAKMEEKENMRKDYSEKWWFGKVWENFMWYMPKVAEWVSDVWDIIQMKRWKTDERSVQFGNYIYDKYGKNAKSVSSDQLDKDYKQFMSLSDEQRKEYTPTLLWAWTKELEWITDVVITATPWGAAIKWILSATWATPWLNVINKGLWMAVWWLWRLINYIPLLSTIRDNLPNDKERKDWDAFIWWVWINRWIKWFQAVKNLKAWDFRVAYWIFKTKWMSAAVKELNARAWWNAIKQLSEVKSDAAQRVTQAEEATAKEAEQWLDIVNKSKDISKVKSIDELSTLIDEEIKAQKWKQTEVAAQNDIQLSREQLLDKRPADIVGWEKQAMATTPVENVLDIMIDYYKDTNPRVAAKYKSYKNAIENWTIKYSDLLNLKREANSFWNDYYNPKTNQMVDTKAAEKFSSNMEWFNNVVENIEWGKDIRATDAQLSDLYTLRNAVNEIKKSAFKEKWKATRQSALWKVLWRMASWLMFGAWDVVKRIYASFMQQVFKVEPKSMSSLEIARDIPEFLNDYKDAVYKLERAKSISEAEWVYDTFAKQRWLDNRKDFETAVKEQKSQTPKWILLWEYSDDAWDDIDTFLNGKNK